MAQKWVYSFGAGQSEGNASMKDVLGGKGANLAEMAKIDLPVPPGFTFTTEVCPYYFKNKFSYPVGLMPEVMRGLAAVENQVGAFFGDAQSPLLLAVRSGARVSMPGMMDTVLNVGLNDVTVFGLARRSRNERFAWDCYRRFIESYGAVVLGIDSQKFAQVVDNYKQTNHHGEDNDVPVDGWQQVVRDFKALVENQTGSPFPQNVVEQLWGAIGAVLQSWMSSRAIAYRKQHDIPQEWGTAITVQAMVFGNMGGDCLTGVAFTRDPSSGANFFYGEYLDNAQGEDIVAGLRTPLPLSAYTRDKNGYDTLSLEELMPTVYNQLLEVRNRLEQHFCDMQDIEFTVQKGRLYILQTRAGKRTEAAARKIAQDMVRQGLVTKPVE